MMKRIISIGFAAWIVSLAAISEARTVRETAYRYEQIWSAAVRFLRVDNGFQIIEQDKETGYVLFEYKDSQRTVNGSVELVPTDRAGATFVTVGIRIQEMPSYVEVMLADKFVRKLRDEYGDPPPMRRIENAPKKDRAKGDASKEQSADKRDPSEQDAPSDAADNPKK